MKDPSIAKRSTLDSSRSSSLLRRTLSSLSLSIRTDGESSEEIRGKYGLNILSAPAEPFVDLIFIHGLGGGSRKTWSANPDPASFWPKEWLPRDPEFKHVRIHSFGYNSEWMNRRESTLGIDDFAKTFLEAMQASSFIRRSSELPIILAAHSMGGLVIKKAYLLARNDPAFQNIAQRLHTMYFLATPHRGAESAELLSTLLRASTSGNHRFVNDLHRDSPAIQAINDDFRHVASYLRLYSYIESHQTSFGGVLNRIIVPRMSAIMGLSNERTAHLNADHRRICKFNSPDSPDYKLIRGNIIETLDILRENRQARNRDQMKIQKRRLRAFLCISDPLEPSYPNFSENREPGSCEWLIRQQSLRQWRDSPCSRLFWLHGAPATGKSYLADFVLEHLNDTGQYCSYHFAREGDTASESLSRCLLLLAYQMADADATIRDAFLSMQDDGVEIDINNYQSIWRKLFVGGMFQLELHKPHFWVFDALDECTNALDLLPLISRIPASFPLRIFLTSRPSLEFASEIDAMATATEVHGLSPDDTLEDIQHYIESHINFPSMRDPETRDMLIKMILGKSEGCFLWVRLVLRELRRVHSEAATQAILEDIPTGMDSLYLRILRSMSTASYGKDLVKAILQWVACSKRPQTPTELSEALSIDIDDTVPNLDSQIVSLCGNLLYVDSQMRIKMIHQTARRYLMRPGIDSEFTFSEEEGHRRIAITCLKYLSGPGMKAPRTRRTSTAHASRPVSPFLSYAARAFYGHVSSANSKDKRLLILLFEFLSSRSGNVLRWIEYIASEGALHHLIEAGKVLQSYVKRRTGDFPIMEKEIKVIEAWGTDLVRLVAKFGYNLVRSPSSIYRMIPSLCPRATALYKQYGMSPRAISVKGLSFLDWDDRLACIFHDRGFTSAVTCNDGYFAIGASNKAIRLYRSTTYQDVGQLVHGEHVRLLKFSISGQLLASSGRNTVRVWDVADKYLKWEFRTPRSTNIAMNFDTSNSNLILACSDNHLYTYNLNNGELVSREAWYKDDLQTEIYSTPVIAAFSLEDGLLAFVYKRGHINIWDWRNQSFVGVCEKPRAHLEHLPFHTSSLLFNPAPGQDSLAAAYEGGMLVVFDPLEGNIKATFEADTGTQILACSNDGRTLVSGDPVGTIRVFDFERFDEGKLKIMYIIHGRGENIRGLTFFRDSMKFVDIRDQQANIWEPASLVRQISEDMSDTGFAELREPSPLESQSEEIDAITEVMPAGNGEHAFCGTESGQLKVMDTTTGMQKQILYEHSKGIEITKIAVDHNRELIASVGISSKVLVHKFNTNTSPWTVQLLLEHCMKDTVEDLIFNPCGTKILITSTSEDVLYTLGDESVRVASLSWQTRNMGIWVQSELRPTQLFLVLKDHIRIYDWNALEELTSAPVTLSHDLPNTFEITKAYSGWNGHVLVTEHAETSHTRPQTRILLWDAQTLTPSCTHISPIPILQPLSNNLSQLIKTTGQIISPEANNLIFLDQNGWVCSLSMSMGMSVPSVYRRHFFLPNDWLSVGNSGLLFRVTVQQDVLFAKGGELAVIKRGMECVEIVAFGDDDGADDNVGGGSMA